MVTAVALRPVTAYGSVRCPSCGHFLPARTDEEVVCSWCGVVFPVTY